MPSRRDPNHDTGTIIRFVHLHKRTGKRGKRYPFCGRKWGYVIDADRVGPLDRICRDCIDAAVEDSDA